MGKKKGGFKTKRKETSVVSDEEDDKAGFSSKDFVFDDDEETDKLLLHTKKQRQQNSDDEDAVFDIGEDSSDGDDFGSFEEDSEDEKVYLTKDSDDDIDMGSDIENKEEENDLPSDKKWGKKSKNYYQTDFVDEDWSGGYSAEKQEIADMEEQEALALQKTMAEQLDAADFDLEFYQPSKPKEKEAKPKEEKVELDLSSLSKEEKLEILRQESPELLPLLQENKEKVKELVEVLEPLMELVKSGKVPSGPGRDYLCLKYNLTVMYLTNLQFYLLLKTRRLPTGRHPVMKRLAQYRKLLLMLAPADDAMQEQVDALLECLRQGKELRVATSGEAEILRQQHQRNIEKTSEKRKKKKGIKAIDSLITEQDMKEMNAQEESDQENLEELLQGETKRSEEDEKEEDAEEERTEEEKRAITYQIAKNKGLTPYRKKEYKNPRVKHRIKFRKAVIRRKGMVRVPRKETEKYGGELSGIRTGVVKSVKIK